MQRVVWGSEILSREAGTMTRREGKRIPARKKRSGDTRETAKAVAAAIAIVAEGDGHDHSG